MAKVQIKGAIVSNDDKWVYDWCEIEATCPKDVSEAIDKANGEKLEVVINSGGGCVYSGSEIYTFLKDYKSEVYVKIVGVAASMASVIAMAGDKVQISPTAQIMIHNIRSGIHGDYRDLGHRAEVMKGYNESIANSYMLKAGIGKEEALTMMDHETWLNAKEAKEKGFVDEIMFDERSQLVASISGSLLPPEVLNKIKNQIKTPPEDKVDFLMPKARLNLLKMRGATINE